MNITRLAEKIREPRFLEELSILGVKDVGHGLWQVLLLDADMSFRNTTKLIDILRWVDSSDDAKVDTWDSVLTTEGETYELLIKTENSGSRVISKLLKIATSCSSSASTADAV